MLTVKFIYVEGFSGVLKNSTWLLIWLRLNLKLSSGFLEQIQYYAKEFRMCEKYKQSKVDY